MRRKNTRGTRRKQQTTTTKKGIGPCIGCFCIRFESCLSLSPVFSLWGHNTPGSDSRVSPLSCARKGRFGRRSSLSVTRPLTISASLVSSLPFLRPQYTLVCSRCLVGRHFLQRRLFSSSLLHSAPPIPSRPTARLLMPTRESPAPSLGSCGCLRFGLFRNKKGATGGGSRRLTRTGRPASSLFVLPSFLFSWPAPPPLPPLYS